jgi:hypothetical protein
MRYSLILFAFAAADSSAIANPLEGQRGASARASLGAISGDIYLLTQSGDVKRGAANEVLLFQSPAHIEKEYSGVCAAQAAQLQRLIATPPARAGKVPMTIEDSLAANKRAITALQASMASILDNANKGTIDRRALIHSLAWRRSPTGINGHFAFDSLAPGHYTLVAAMRLGNEDQDWFVPITIASRQRLAVDLDNHNLFTEAWNCDHGPPVK